jgi:hypothetical protein
MMRRHGVLYGAVVQAAAVGFDLDRGLEKVGRLPAEASAGGASLAVFPEAFLPGYPRGITFGTVVGDHTREGREHFRRYFDASVDVPGPVVDRLAEIAAETALHPGDRCGGARRWNPVLHGLVLLARELPGQAPQADADSGGTDRMGVRGRVDHAGVRHAAGIARRMSSLTCTSIPPATQAA